MGLLGKLWGGLNLTKEVGIVWWGNVRDNHSETTSMENVGDSMSAERGWKWGCGRLRVLKKRERERREIKKKRKMDPLVTE